MELARRLLLKSVLATLILGGNCFVCGMVAPTALAAEPTTESAASRCGNPPAVSVLSIGASVSSLVSDAVTVQARRLPAPDCPMLRHYDSYRATGSVGTERTGFWLINAGSPSDTSDFRLPRPVFLRETISSDPAGRSDRTSVLTGTTVKNE